MINKNLSKISEFGIWLIQWFGDFSKDIKVKLKRIVCYAEVLEKEEKAIDNAIQRIRKKLSRNLTGTQ